MPPKSSMPNVQKMKIDYSLDEMQKLLDSSLCENLQVPITVVDLPATGEFYLTDGTERSLVLLHSMIEEKKNETHYWKLYYRENNSIYFFDTCGKPESFDFVSFLRANKAKFESESFKFWICGSWFAYEQYNQTLGEDGLSEHGITGALCFELARSIVSISNAMNLVEKKSEEIIGDKRPWLSLSSSSKAHVVKRFDLSREGLSENLKSLFVSKDVKEIDHFVAARMTALREITTAQNAVLQTHSTIASSALPTPLKSEAAVISVGVDGSTFSENPSGIPPTASLLRTTELLVTGDSFKHNSMLEEMSLIEPVPGVDSLQESTTSCLVPSVADEHPVLVNRLQNVEKAQKKFESEIQFQIKKANETITTLMTQFANQNAKIHELEQKIMVLSSEPKVQKLTRPVPSKTDQMLKQIKYYTNQAQIVENQSEKIKELEDKITVLSAEPKVQRLTRSVSSRTDHRLKQKEDYTSTDDNIEVSKAGVISRGGYHKKPTRQARANSIRPKLTFFETSPAPVRQPPKDLRRKVDNGSELDHSATVLNLSEGDLDKEWRSDEALVNELQNIPGLWCLQ